VKRTLIASALLAASTSVFALNAGDLLFTNMNTERDGFAVAAFADIAAGTQIYFNDNEWGGTSFNTGESGFRWTVGSDIVKGQVISFDIIDPAGSAPNIITSSNGTLTLVSGTNIGFSQSGETLYMYTGANATAPTTFISAISTFSTFTGTNGLLAGTGLAAGVNAVALGSAVIPELAEYTANRAGELSFSAYQAKLVNVANWTLQDESIGPGNNPFEFTTANTTAFTITPIPEPTETALMLSALGIIGAIARRRRQAK
jgi:hypothetical protein